MSTPERLDTHEYAATQQQLLLFGGILADWPLDRFIATAEHADATAWFLDPTLYRAGADNLHAIMRIAKAAKAFQDVVIAERQRATQGPAR